MKKPVTEEARPSWLTQGRTVLAIKDPQQGLILSNYRLSSILADNFGDYLDGYMHQALRFNSGRSRASKQP